MQNQCFPLFSYNLLEFKHKSRGRSASARGGLTAWSIWEILRPISRMHYFLMAKHVSFGLNTSPFLWVRIKISKIFMPAQPPPDFANFNENWRESCEKSYHNTVFYNAESMFSMICIQFVETGTKIQGTVGLGEGRSDSQVNLGNLGTNQQNALLPDGRTHIFRIFRMSSCQKTREVSKTLEC